MNRYTAEFALIALLMLINLIGTIDLLIRYSQATPSPSRSSPAR